MKKNILLLLAFLPLLLTTSCRYECTHICSHGTDPSQNPDNPNPPSGRISFTPNSGSFELTEEGYYLLDLNDEKGQAMHLILYPTSNLAGNYKIDDTENPGTILSRSTAGESWFQEQDKNKTTLADGSISIIVTTDNFSSASFNGNIVSGGNNVVISSEMITLEDKTDPIDPPTSDPIRFNTVSANYKLDAAKLELTLTNAEGDQIFMLFNLLGGMDGNYIIDQSGEKGTIMGATKDDFQNASWYRKSDSDTKEYLTSGKILLKIDDKETYLEGTTSGIARTLDNNEIEIITEQVALYMFTHYEMKSGELMYYGPTPGANTAVMVLYVKDHINATDGKMTCNSTIYMNMAIPESGAELILPSGTYTSAPATWEEFTFNDALSETYRTHWYTISDDGKITGHNPIKGEIIVSRKADVYTIEVIFYETEHSGVTFSWVGPLEVSDYS